MSTAFPTALDVLTNPSGTDALDAVAVPHATQHANANDAIEALQAKVGIDGSPVATSMDYKVSAIQSSVDLKAPLASPSFTGNVSATGSILSVGAGIGYGPGAGGTVTQATGKGTAITLNKPTGQITLSNSALAAGASTGFWFNNGLIGPTDIVLVSVLSGGSPLNYRVWTGANGGNGNGSIGLYIKNETAGPLAEAVVLVFAIIKVAAS